MPDERSLLERLSRPKSGASPTMTENTLETSRSTLRNLQRILNTRLGHARAKPHGAHFVGETSSDPDVERLLEGFAFLTARLRQKLENELPELTHSLLELLWPHYLRPIPSMTIVQFEALPQAAKEIRTIA